MVLSEANHSAVGVEHWSERGQYHALSLATSLNIYLNRKYVTLRATLPVFISVVTRLKADSPGRIRA